MLAQPGYLVLEEAIAQGVARVTELGEGGSVPELRVENLGEQPVLLLDGEELVGAKQDRVLNLTFPCAGETGDHDTGILRRGRPLARGIRHLPARRTRHVLASARCQSGPGLLFHANGGQPPVRSIGSLGRGRTEKTACLRAPSPTQAMNAIYGSAADTERTVPSVRSPQMTFLSSHPTISRSGASKSGSIQFV